MIKPCGYNVLVKTEEIEKKDDSFVEGSELIVAAPQTQKDNRDLAEREQAGHYRGVLVALGPTAYHGYQGCDAETAEERAKQWGVSIGDTVRFNRYDGISGDESEGGELYRVVQDGHLISVIED